MMKVRFCSWVVGWALIAAAACAEDGAQRFLSGSGLDRLAATDNDLATVSKEFALAWGEFQEKAPEYVQRQVQVWMVEEAINFKKDSEGYASNDFRVRDNCRKLHNLTSRILSMSNRQFPTEVEWNRSVSVLSGLPQEFASQVATRNSIPATIANTLNGTFNSWVRALTRNPLSPTCFLNVDEELVADLKSRATKLIDPVSVYFSQLGRDEITDLDRRFVQEACSEAYLEMIESAKGRLPQRDRSREELDLKARLEPVAKRYTDGFAEAHARDFSERNARQRAEMDAESSPEAVAAEVARNREWQKKTYGPFPEAPAKAKQPPLQNPKQIHDFRKDVVPANPRSGQNTILWLIPLNLAIIGLLVWIA